MKIVFFTENSYKGGLDTVIITLINNWPGKDDEITLICNHSHPGIERYENEIKRNVKFFWHNLFIIKDFKEKILNHFNSKLLSKIIAGILKYFFKTFIFIYYIISLKKTLLKNKPNRLMVINGGYPGGMTCQAATISWGLFSKKKYALHNFHNIAVPITKNKIIEIYIDKLVDRYSSLLISVSKIAAESLRCRKAFENTQKIKFIYNGIEHDFEKNTYNSDIKKELSLNLNSKICLMLGSYEPRKGHLFLLKSFSIVIKSVPEAQLLICGYGSDNEVNIVKEYVKQLKLQNNVTLLNFRNDLDNLLANTDILLISSQAFESFGLTAVEAMANKVPVVSTNIGGLKEVIKNDHGGYLFEKDDVKNYSSKIIELLQNKELRLEQGKKGQIRFRENFIAKRMANEYAKIIKS